MRLRRVVIENFRNFSDLDVSVGRDVVLVGENGVGKSNFLHALRLVLDPSLPDAARDLRLEDLWDGVPRPLTGDERLEVSIELTDFQGDDDQLALLAEHLIEPSPMVARLTYVWKPREDLKGPPTKDSDFEWYIFGGDREENRVGHEVRRRLPLELLPALRDSESDLSKWAKSPLRPLLDSAAGQIPYAELEKLAASIDHVTSEVAKVDKLADVTNLVNSSLIETVGKQQALDTTLRFSPTDPDRLIRSLRLHVDGGKRSIGDASLGSANLLYLVLKRLQYRRAASDGEREHTFTAIEEPEAHLHPHVQRLVYKSLLKDRSGAGDEDDRQSVLLTTHSPHIASVSPLPTFVVLRYEESDASTRGRSTASIAFKPEETADLERYLEVSRAELLFARGVILVEGEAERWVVPVLASNAGYDLDKLGITVCSISGTHFAAYLKLLGPKGLDVPFAVITDRDKKKPKGKAAIEYGLNRYCKNYRPALGLAKLLPGAFKDTRDDAAANGIFFNSSTFEIALFKAGAGIAYAHAVQDLTSNSKLIERFKEWAKTPKKVPAKAFLRDVDTLGKGALAQKVASALSFSAAKECPTYIKKALKHVVQRVQS